MNPPQFLEALSSRGVQVLPEPAAPLGYKVVGPGDVLTPHVVERIRAALPALRPYVLPCPPRTDNTPLNTGYVKGSALPTVAESERRYARGWAEILLILEQLPPIAWPMKQGVHVPCIARYLRLAGEKRNQLFRLWGAGWRGCPAGRELVSDLEALRVFISLLPMPEGQS